MNGIGINVLSEAESRKDADFSASVVAVNVCGGVTLCIAVFLSKQECLLKGHTVGYHFGKNKVCCAVKNTCDFVNIVCGKALADRSDNGNAAAYAGFKQEVNVVFVCNLQQLAALCGNKLLV